VSIIRERWSLIVVGSLLLAVGMSIARLILPTIPTDLPTLCYILFCIAYLLSEKIGGKFLTYFEKATFYFVSYLLLFFIVEHQLNQLVAKFRVSVILPAVVFFLTSIVFLQTRYFSSRARDKKESRAILILGVALAVFLCVLLLYIREGTLLKGTLH